LEQGLGLDIGVVVAGLGSGWEFDWEILDVVGLDWGIEEFEEFDSVAESTAGFAADKAAAAAEVAEAVVAFVEVLADFSATVDVADTELSLEDLVDFVQANLEDEPVDCRVNC